MFTTSPADCSALILPDLHQLAIQTDLICRKSSKFTADGFLQSLLSSVVTGQGSLNQIASELNSRVGKPMSRQSLHERFGPSSTSFLLAVCGALMKQRFESSSESLLNSKITEILIEDACGQVMPKANADYFPAHENHHGKSCRTKALGIYETPTGPPRRSPKNRPKKEPSTTTTPPKSPTITTQSSPFQRGRIPP